MKLEQLQHLVAIVEQGSLRAAARRLQATQPAVTRSIRALEAELGAPLFLRESTGMVLTTAGRRFHLRASTIVNEARRAREEMAHTLGDEQGSVAVALSIMPHVGLVPRALPAFRHRYPKVRLQLIEGLFPDIESPLREGSIDFYMGAAPRAAIAPGLEIEHLLENTRAVVCRRGHPLADAQSLSALAQADWAVTAVDYNADDDLVTLFASLGLAPPSVMLRARSAMSIMVALAHSDLLAMLPVQWREFPMTNGVLQMIRVRERLPAPAIVTIRKPDFPLTPAAEYLSSVLQRQLPLRE